MFEAIYNDGGDTIYLCDQIEDKKVSSKDFWISLNNVVHVADWDNAFTLISGKGMKLNGVSLSGAVMKPQDTELYVGLGTEAKTGDVLTIDAGLYRYFYNGVTIEVTFASVQTLKWNGSSWEKCSETLYDLGVLSLAVNSTNSHATNNQLYLKNTNDVTLPIKSWDYAFMVETVGLKVNNTPATISEFKSPGDIWLKFAAVELYDTVTLSGTFVYGDARYMIEESKFVWNGSKWEPYVEFTTYNTGTLKSTSSSSASALYLKRFDGKAFEVTDGTWATKLTLRKNYGVGVTLDGEALTLGVDDVAIPGTLYIALNKTATVGQVVIVEGQFYNVSEALQYNVAITKLMWDGAKWVNVWDEDTLADYETVTMLDLNMGVEKIISGDIYNKSGASYNFANDTGSVKFRFGYTSTNIASGCIDIRLRGGSWAGVHFRINAGTLELIEVNTRHGYYTLSANTNYTIEIVAQDTADGNYIYAYALVNGEMAFSHFFAKAGDYSGYNTNHLSIYAVANTYATLTDPDNVSVTEVNGSVSYFEKDATYELAAAPADSTFVGWNVNGTLYPAGETISLTENVVINSVVIDFMLKDGAAIRLAGNADESGIRFTSMMNTADMEALKALGVTINGFGTLIMPNDYLANGQAPNLTDFSEANKQILQIENTGYTDDINGYTVYYGAMKTIKLANYARDFAGRGYIEITFANGAKKFLYTPFSVENNVRSIRTVAQAFKADETEPEGDEIRYNTLSDTRKAIVDAYANSADYQKAAPASVALTQMEEGYQAAYVVNNNKENVTSASQRKENV